MQNMDLEFGKSGQLTIQGIDDPVVDSGPYTVNTWTTYGTSDDMGHSVNVSGTPWTSNSKRGKFIHVLTGTQTGSYYAIGENNTNQLYMANTYFPLSPGDTFEIVTPGTIFDTGGGFPTVNISLTGTSDAYETYNCPFAMSRIEFANWSWVLELSLNGVFISLPFFKANYVVLYGTYGHINHSNMKYPDELIEEKLKPDDYPYLYLDVAEIYTTYVQFFRLTADSIFTGASCFLADSYLLSFKPIGWSWLIIDRCLAGSTGGTFIDQFPSGMQYILGINKLYILSCSNLLKSSLGGVYTFANIEGNSPTNYMAILNRDSQLSLSGTNIIRGGTADIQWEVDSSTSPFPFGNGDIKTDGACAKVCRNNGATNHDNDIYVDTVNGDDETGTGTSGNPYQTLTRAVNELPDIVDEAWNIFISAPSSNPVTDSPIITPKVTINGQLTIQGIDDPTVISAGPYTVNTYTNIGTGSCAHNINVSGASFTTDAFRGYFVRALTGSRAGKVYAIAHNTATDIVIGFNSYALSPGDTFDIVSPGTCFDAYDYQWAIHPDQDTVYWFKSNIIFAGIDFVWTELMIDCTGYNCMRFPFCKIRYLTVTSNALQVNDLDWKYPAEAYNSGWSDNNISNSYIDNVFNLGNYNRFSKTILGEITAQGTNLYIYRSTLKKIRQNQPPDNGCVIYRSYFYNTSGPGIETLNGAIRVNIQGIYIEQCTDFVDAKRCDIDIIDTIQINSVSGYLLKLGFNSKVGFAGTLPSGTTGDIYWVTTSTPDTFPTVVGTNKNDGNGSYVVKLS